MKRAFVDTSAWFAYARRNEPHHEGVAAALRRWDGRLVTSNFIFDELVSLASSRIGHEAAAQGGDLLRDPSTVELVRLLPEDEDEAWSFFKRHKDKGYSFTDCTSFALMRRLHIPLAIATDKHFRQAGFDVEPAIA